MRRVVKNVLACLVSTLLFVSAWAQESVPEAISVNFGQTLSGDDTVGVMPVAAKQWVCVGNVGGATGGQPAELSSVTLKDQTGKDYPSAKLKVASRGGSDGGMWTNGNQDSLTGRLLYNFIDDSKGSNEACVEVTHVPFARYTVYVYFNGDFTEGDANKFPPYEVNGKLYKGNGSTTVQITDFTSDVTAWGTVKKSVLQEGQNVLKVTGQSADTLRIYASRYASVEGFTPSSPGGRGCISAIQIVSEEALPAAFTCTFDGTPKPAGWFTGWGGETPSVYVPTPFGKGFVVGDTASPYYGLGAKNAFSLMLYADIAAVDVSDNVPKVLATFGTRSGGYIALLKTAEDAVEVRQVDETKISIQKAALKAGFHLFAFGNDATGSFLSVDGVREEGNALSVPASGLQIGSTFSGNGDWGKAAGMIVDEVRGYDTVLTEEQVTAQAKTFSVSLVRTLAAEANDWEAENAWGEGINAPDRDASVELTVASEATLTMNADAALSYLLVEGEGALTFAGDKKLSSASTHIATDVNAVNGVASLGEVSVAEGKKLTVGAMTFPSLNAAGAYFATAADTGTITLKAMVGAPASITVGDGSTLVLPANVSQGNWTTPYAVGAGATLNVNGVYDNSNTSLSLAEGATLTNGGQDVNDLKRQWQNLAIATPEGSVTVSGNTFGSVSSNHNEHFLTLNGGTLNVEMNDGKSFYMANLTVRKTAEDAAEDVSEAGTLEVVSGALRLTYGGDYSRVNLNLTGGEVLSSTEQTFGSFSGTGGTLNLNGQTLTVGAFGKTDIFSGAIVGSGKLKKVGSGTLDLHDAQMQDVCAVALEEGTLILGTLRPKMASVASGTILELTASSAEKRAGQLSLGVALTGVTVKVDGKEATVGDNGTVSFEKDESAVPTWTPTTDNAAWGTVTTWTNLTGEQVPISGTVKIDLSQAPTEITLTLDTPATLDYVELVNGGEKTVTFALGEGVSVAMTELISNAAVSIPAQVIAEATTVKLPGKTLTLTGTCDACNAVVKEVGKVVVGSDVTYTPNANVALSYALDLAGGTLRSTVGRTCSGKVTLTADSTIICEGGTLTLNDGTRNDLVLGEYTLTKSGGQLLKVDTVDLENGTLAVTQGTLQLATGTGGDCSVKDVTLSFAAGTDFTAYGWLFAEGTLTLDCAKGANVTMDKPVRNRTGKVASLMKTGAGAVEVQQNGGADHCSGTFTVEEGTLTLRSDAEITREPLLTVAQGATLKLVESGLCNFLNAKVNGHVQVADSANLRLVAAETQTIQSLNVAKAASVTLIGKDLTVNQLTGGAGALIVGDGSSETALSLEGANGGYAGEVTVTQGTTLAYNDAENVPFGKGTIVNQGLVRMTQDSIAQIPPMSGTGNLEVAGSARMAGPLTLTGTVTVAAGKTLTLSRHQTDFTGTPSIDGPSLVLRDGAKVVKGEFGEGVTLASGTTLSGAGTVEAPVTFAAGAVVDASAGAPTLTQGVTLPTEGTVSVKAPAGGHGIVLTANGLVAAKFALVGGSACQALTATDTALVLMQVPEGVDVSSAAGKAILAAAQAANVTNVEKVEGDDIDGAALFTEVVTVEGTTATVAYDFGISRMFIRKESETTYLYLAAKVSTDYAGNTTVKVFQDGTEVEATLVTEGVPNEAGVKWLRVAYPADTFGTHHYTIQAASAEP